MAPPLGPANAFPFTIRQSQLKAITIVITFTMFAMSIYVRIVCHHNHCRCPHMALEHQSEKPESIDDGFVPIDDHLILTVLDLKNIYNMYNMYTCEREKHWGTVNKGHNVIPFPSVSTDIHINDV